MTPPASRRLASSSTGERNSRTMSHTITGIDLGSWSVKFTVLEAGFRRSRAVTSFEERIAQDERPFAERQQEALRLGMSRLPSETTTFVALPGDMLTLR